jgi:GAF domain-containing protein
LKKLQSDARWREHPELTRSVYCETAEAALLCNRFELSTELCDEVLAHSSTTLEKAPAHELLIRGLAARKRFGEAVVKALDVQAELKIRYPRNPNMGHVIWGYIWTLRKVKALGADHLLRLPPREDPEVAAASRLMQAVFAITHFHKPELYPLFVFRQVEQCVTHGNDAYAAQAYSALSMILAGLGEVELAERICNMSVELTSTPPGDKLRCRSLFVLNSFVVPWLHPVRDSFPQLARAAQAALEHGDFEFFGYAVTMRGLGQLYSASGLAELTAEFEKVLSQLAALGHERNVLMQRILCEAAHELRHGVPLEPLSGPFYQKVDALARCQDPMDHTLVFHHYLAELCVSAHFGDVENAVRVVELVKPHLANGAFGSYLIAPFLFYEAWALGASAPLPGRSAFKARRRLAQSEKQLWKWRKSAPMNFGSKWHFVQAERLRLSGRHDEALKSYESAIEESRAQGYFNEAAVAHERAATLWIERGFARLAGQHLRDAHALYVHWGAVAAAERLTTAHPQHVSLFPARPSSPGEAPRSSESLDYHALIKASQAISGETLQPRLLERLLQTIMEHTAAQRGVLLLEQRGQLMVEAEADVDRPHVELIANETAESTTRVSRSIVRYAVRLEKTVVLAEATEDATFGRDPYVQTQRPRSVLCTPILHQGKLLGLLYLENNRVGHVFTRARLEMVSLLASQAAISIGNARLHALKLEAQQAKISPHFLFNALSSIAELAILDGAKAESAIVKLAHLYRYILASSPTEMVSLERELSIVRDYLGLEKLRFGAKLDFSVSHEGPLDKVRVPGLLIQPLVENSIRHAVAPKLGDGRVWVHARVHGDGCTIVVQDDGDGTKHASTGTGFGLRNVQQRLELVYGTRYSFAISQRGGYRVELEIPHEATSQLN